jgi:hypothetical protein
MTLPWRSPVMLAVMLGLVPFVVAACRFDDPTELNFYVSVVNDTPRSVVLADCATGDAFCRGRLFEPYRLQPGKTLKDVQTSVGALNVELVTSINGRRIGCLPLYFSYNASGTILHVSQTTRCRGHYAIRHRSP